MADGDVSLEEVGAAIRTHRVAWEAGDNPISRLSGEQRFLRLGVPLPPPDQLARMTAPAHSAAAPIKFDLRNVGGKNYITGVRDQANCGSCVAFGCVATVEGSIAFQTNHPNPTMHLSEAHLYYCYGAKEHVTCATGWLPNKALVYCISGGLVDDACFPYTAHDQPCNLCSDWQKRLTKIKSQTPLTKNPAAMKDWISKKGPIIGCFVVYQDFFYYKSGIYKHTTGAQAGGHCVAIVGYDDSTNCWICKNSWTTSWGESGFFRIAYGECMIEAWENIGVNA